jgi:SET domain-containing protein
MTMAISSFISAKATKGESSRIQGRGLFATAPIAAGEIVAIKGGHIVTTAALHGLPDRLRNSEIQIADGFHLVAMQDSEYEPVMLFLNHSCEPNVGFMGNVVLVAMRDVEQGEELTTDYALFDDCDEPMDCRCGAASCRGLITGRDWRRPELQRKYGGYFSAYLTDRFADSSQGTGEPGSRGGES